jgi:hypothetical protein
MMMMTNFNSENEGKYMKTENSNSGDNAKQGHTHAKHMKMMAICCGLPIIGFLAIGILGISMPSLETLLLLICPIGMIGMMYMMHRDSQGRQKENSCCNSEKSEIKPIDAISLNDTEKAEHDPTKTRQPGSLKA